MNRSFVSILSNTRMFLILGLLSCFVSGPGSVHLARAQAGEPFEITLEGLGYGDRVLRGPVDQARYYFGLPAYWEFQEGSYLTLNLEYAVSGQAAYAPASLEVQLNSQVLHTENLETLGTYQVRVDIPPGALLSFESRYLNTLELKLWVYAECDRAQLTSLAVYASSSLHFAYSERPLPVDLALYPRPLYQQGFEPNVVRLVLPATPRDVDVQAAAMVASRLGKLAGGDLTISTTLASDVQAVSRLDEHLIVVGQPASNPLLAQLDLPLPLAERRLVLHSQMPAQVVPGKVFSYTLSVKNTTEESQVVSVEDRLPATVAWLSCSGECQQDESGMLRWQIGDLPAGEEVSTVVQLRLDEQVSPDEWVEHTATLFDNEGNAINVDTLTTAVSTTTSEQVVTSASEKGAYFFVQTGRGVAESDGVVQELLSPWDSRRAVVVVTGLSEEALLKAAHALSSRTRFPGMSGTYALVRNLQPLSAEAMSSPEDLPFSWQRDQDAVLRAKQLEMVDYTFDVPWGWSVADGVYAALHFAHGLSGEGLAPTLEVQLNNVPICSVPLSEENATDAWLVVPLPKGALKIGPNQLRLRLSYDLGWCANVRYERDWLTIYADSFFHVPREAGDLALDLGNFPQPFSGQRDLQNLAFLLPTQPTPAEVEGTLRLATNLGRAAGGNDFLARVALGGDPAVARWSGYNLIIVGRPTTNPYLAAVNHALPQPFYPGTDEFQQRVDNVVFRLAPGTSVGFIQALFAPWDASQAILVATGTTDAGVGWAVNALLDGQLAGNLALVREGEVYTADTRPQVAKETAGAVATLVPKLLPEVCGTLTLTEPPSVGLALISTPTTAVSIPVPGTLPTVTRPVAANTRPRWLLPLLVVGVLTIIGAAVAAVWGART